jgi:hypothetical protein
MIDPHNPNTPKLIQLVIKYSGGLIKDDKQASYVLIGFVLVAIVFSFLLIFGGRDEVNFNPEDYPYGIVSPEET